MPFNPEFLGVPASVLLLISYFFKDQKKLRIINTVGCLFFVSYGFALAIDNDWQVGWSTIILNAICVVVHLYYLVGIIREERAKRTQEKNPLFLKEKGAKELQEVENEKEEK